MASFASSSNISITGGNFIINNINQTFDNAFEKLSRNVAHSALYGGPARSDTTRCFQGTRTDVLDNAQRWIEEIGACLPVLWLYGGAGAGKSAIMQTLSERWIPQRLAMGAFFFSRTDTTRNTANVLIPTLAYQLAQSYPVAMELLASIINSDPIIFKKSVEVQTSRLLVQPLQELIRTGYMTVYPRSLNVFLIDGLDECVDPTEQLAVIKAIAAVLHDHSVPIKFLVASRPEPAISTAFESYGRQYQALKTISLSAHKDSEHDIHRFLVFQFLDIRLDHPFKNLIPPEWPPHEAVMALLRKSSGHFIFASIAMRYIASLKENPVRSLDVILGLNVVRGHPSVASPFSELDALYHLVLGNAAHGHKVLQIIAHCIFSSLPPLVSIICLITDCTASDIPVFLIDVSGLVCITRESRPEIDGQEDRVQILHASLIDFLRDPSRSRSLCLDEKMYHSVHLESHFRLLEYYSQGGLSSPEWPLSHGDDRGNNYAPLGAQIFKSIQISAHVPLTQRVLRAYSLQRFHSIQSGFVDETEEFPSVYAGLVTYMGIIQSANINDGGYLYRTSLKQFFDILWSYLQEEMGPLASVILPLILSQYPMRTVRSIIYHFEGERKIPYLQYTITQLLLQPCRTFRLGRMSVFDKLDIDDLRAALSHEASLNFANMTAAAAEAVLGHIFAKGNAPKSLYLYTPHKTWMRRHKPGKHVATGRPILASAFHIKCAKYKLNATITPENCRATRRRYLGLLSTSIAINPKPDTLYFLLLDAALWLLQKVDASNRALAYTGRLLPKSAYLRYPTHVRQLQTYLDTYSRPRIRNAKMLR